MKENIREREERDTSSLIESVIKREVEKRERL